MRNFVYILLLAFAIFTGVGAKSQSIDTWSVTNATLGSFTAIERVSDNKYITAFADSAIVFFDSVGNVISTKSLHLPYNYSISSMRLANDGGIYYGGRSLIHNPDSSFLIYGKLDSLGDHVWSRRMFVNDTIGWYQDQVMLEPDTAAGGFYAVLANTLAKVSDIGDTLWTKDFRVFGHLTRLQCIETCENQDIIVGGVRDSLVGPTGHSVLARITPQGTTVWNKRYGSDQGYFVIYDAYEMDDNTILTVGRGYYVPDESAVLHVDAQGNMIKAFVRQYFSEVHYRKIIPLPNGEFYFKGIGEWILWTTNYYGTVSKFNANLEHCYTYDIGPGPFDDLCLTPGGDMYYVAGGGLMKQAPGGPYSCNIYPLPIKPRQNVALPVLSLADPPATSNAIWNLNASQNPSNCIMQIFCSCTPPAQPLDLNVSLVDSASQVSFTATSNYGTEWYYNFNGIVSFDQNPVFNYDSTGTYHYAVHVKGGCDIETICDTITLYQTCVDTATADFTFTSSGVSTTFTNQSTNATWYSWNFGDGNTSTNPNPVHTYAMPGTYVVCLSAQDSCQTDVFCDTVTVCTLPIASFNTANSCLSVAFSNSSAYSSSWLWDFGDGSTSSVSNPSHVYSTDGTYNVCLVATNMCDSVQTDTFCQTVEVWSPPTAAFTVTTSGFTGSFVDNSLGATSWWWNFGDGSATSSQNITHTFNTAGTYTVCLTVSNDCDTSTLCSQVVIGNIGMDEQAQLEEVVLYPNPSKGTVSISSSTNSKMEVTVYDEVGRLVCRKSFLTSRDDRELDLRSLSKGTYHVRMVTDNAVHVKRLLLE